MYIDFVICDPPTEQDPPLYVVYGSYRGGGRYILDNDFEGAVRFDTEEEAQEVIDDYFGGDNRLLVMPLTNYPEHKVAQY